MTSEHESTGSLPRFTTLDPAALRSAQIVVLHQPRTAGADVVWSLSLTDRSGRPMAREAVPVPPVDEDVAHVAAEAHLHLVGMQVEGDWHRSREGDDLRHYARVGVAGPGR
ncbi:hypothetical protein FA014_12330 [Cellulomonas hominis]|uniref:Uncharacterized protein n=1 Tax=Cellulomonas hominis TaxID=156981 RepID=A0A7Z8JYU0_9CELL|nr:hypothetical protein [Cellulomonas hominis]TKR23234.1 hypothetical protein FA014_12330 [Cellulomonas hominis]